MNPKAVLLIILGCCLLLGLVMWLIYRNAGVKQSKLRDLRDRIRQAEQALRAIEESTRLYSDLESPLAAAVRTQLADYHHTKKEIY